jgi:hypothetical protein
MILIGEPPVFLSNLRTVLKRDRSIYVAHYRYSPAIAGIRGVSTVRSAEENARKLSSLRFDD